MSGETKNMKKPELVVPAGNPEKLKIALMYGADAVYIGGEAFNLRINAGNFSQEELYCAVDYVHARGKKIYFVLNSFLYDKQIPDLERYLEKMNTIFFDGIIVGDAGMADIVKKTWPDIRIHLSTQANIMNRYAAEFWSKNGISRIVLARELTLPEIKSISKNSSCEMEVFIHGAVCLSFSGRCYLSKYMADRDANLGDCAQSCRWRYSLVEEKRPHDYYPVFEENNLSFILNSMDICGINAIPDIISAGVDALKIEGRMKSSYYLAVVTMIYRQALDNFFAEEQYVVDEGWFEELEMLSHRPYNYYPFSEKKTDLSQETEKCAPKGIFLALTERLLLDKSAVISVRNSLRTGEIIDIISPNKIYVAKIKEIHNDKGLLVEIAHPNQAVSVMLSEPVEPYFILRRRV